MNDTPKPRHILRSALLSMWGLLTLILVFTLGMILYEQYQEGQNPLAFAIRETPASVPTPAQPVETIEASDVSIYFATPNSIHVRPETHRIPLGSSTVRNCQAALNLIIEGPKSGDLIPVMSNRTTVRAMYLLENGELVVDFSRTLEAGHVKSTTAELLMVRSITGTLFQRELRGANDLGVKWIRFLFEGAPYQQTFPAHIDLSDPIRNTTLPGASIEPV